MKKLSFSRIDRTDLDIIMVKLLKYESFLQKISAS